MSTKEINIVSDFGPVPYGRYYNDGEFSGQKFRVTILAPALREYDHVVVILDGYNRYGRSFLDEAFGGLIREEKFSLTDLNKKLTYRHSSVTTIEMLIKDRIEAAARDVKSK